MGVCHTILHKLFPPLVGMQLGIFLHRWACTDEKKKPQSIVGPDFHHDLIYDMSELEENNIFILTLSRSFLNNGVVRTLLLHDLYEYIGPVTFPVL